MGWRRQKVPGQKVGEEEERGGHGGPMEANPGDPGIQRSMLPPCSRQTTDVLKREGHQSAINITEPSERDPSLRGLSRANMESVSWHGTLVNSSSL